MKPSIVIARKIPTEVQQYLEENCICRTWDGDRPIPREELLDALSEAEGLLMSGQRIDDELLNHAPKLRVVSSISVGYNNMDVEAMIKKKVIGTNTPYVLDETVADLVFALLLSTARRIAELDSMVKAGKWQRFQDEELFGVDVHHATLGIIGMGRIGEAVAIRARLGFHMDVVYNNRSRKPEAEKTLGVEYRSLDDLLKVSDFVLMLTPLSAETRAMIGREQFAQMKKSAIFINASRGEVIDEQALIEALQLKEIYGAGLDVYEQEPVDPNNPLLQMPSVVTLPHIGSATRKTRFDMAMLAAVNLVEGLQGKKPRNLIREFEHLQF